MSKVINCSIDVTMIDKTKCLKNANGASYWNFSVLERKEPDAYGNTHYVVERQTKEEREARAPKNYLRSSGKEFVFGGQSQVASNDYSAQQGSASDQDDDDLPF